MSAAMARYPDDVLARARRRVPPAPEVPAQPGLTATERESGFRGRVVDVTAAAVTLADAHGRRREFPLATRGFLVDGQVVTLVRPRPTARPAQRRSPSGSLAPTRAQPRVARASRIYVEGLHDAMLVEKVWGDDLREVGVVVEPLDGVDDLPAAVAAFAPGPGRRLGVLVDHLVAGSKEQRLADAVAGPDVLVTGHPYVDVWQGIRPRALGIPAWPEVPPGRPWKEGVCAAFGVSDPARLWRRLLAAVASYADLEPGLVGAVERLIDFVTEPA